MTAERTIFTLRIAGKTGQAGVRQLRALLKELLRRHKFTCLHAEEEHFTRGSSPKRRRTKSPGAPAQHSAGHHPAPITYGGER